jgi:exodeoxyribonuclease-3
MANKTQNMIMKKKPGKGRQRFLDEEAYQKQRDELEPGVISFLNWNIRNPSVLRAPKQADWMASQGFDVIVLTEVKLSEGCIYIRDRLESLGYAVAFPDPDPQDYGVILAVRRFFKERLNVSTQFLPYRTCSVACNFGRDALVTGVYAPVWRNEEKKRFHDDFEKLICMDNLKMTENRFIVGDLNVLEPDHAPSYPEYKPWDYSYTALCKHGFVDAFRHFHPGEKEYSWFGHTGNGYRFDHIFVTRSVLPFLQTCSYIHKPRLGKLSDHSAMVLQMSRLVTPVPNDP